MIDIAPLKKAHATLERALAALAQSPNDEFVRDACIQRFEYTYELSHKLLRRFLEESKPADTAQLSFPSLIRLGFKRGLLAQSWDVWNDYREARNNTSHAYDDAKAAAVLQSLPEFAGEIRFLVDALQARLGP